MAYAAEFRADSFHQAPPSAAATKSERWVLATLHVLAELNSQEILITP